MLRLLCKHVAAQLHSVSLQQSLPGLPISSSQHWHVSMTTVRMASSRRHKEKNPDLKGYDFILHQWKRSQASGSRRTSSSAAKGHKQHAGNIWFTDAHFGSHSSSSSGSSSGKRRSSSSSSRSARRQQQKPGSFQWRGSWKSTWADADMAATAAAAQLHPDECYNLVFGSDDYDGSSSSSRNSTKSRQERRKARRAKRRARRMQQTAKAWGYAEVTWTDSEVESDDEWQQQQQYGYGSGRPDWQWWDEQQEREWFEQAWRQSGGQQGWQQQQQQYQSHSQHSSRSNSSGRPWWNSFQQGYQQQQQQHREQQQQQQTSQQRGRQRNWQQAGSAVRHPPFVLEHLAVLDLPSDAVLQRAQLKAAFHKAAMRWHPDMHVGDSHKAAAETKFKQVKEAYEHLVLRATA